MNRPKRGFASDNNAGVHPRVMDTMRTANHGHAVAYGDDAYTETAVRLFRERFGEGAEVFFVFGGTGANVSALAAVTRPHQAVVCAETAHVNVDECGAPERFTGCKLIDLPTPDGKLRREQIEPLLARAGDQHHVQPRVVSISQPTELGTVYTVEELTRLAEFAHARGLLLHVDGARLSNAAAHLGVPLRELTAGAGVDVLSFGGTKNGMMYGEAVVFFDPALAEEFKFVRKQCAQLPSKMRFVAAQFTALLTEDLWLQTRRARQPYGADARHRAAWDSANQHHAARRVERDLRRDAPRRGGARAEALLLLRLERADLRGAPDVLVRHDRG